MPGTQAPPLTSPCKRPCVGIRKVKVLLEIFRCDVAAFHPRMPRSSDVVPVGIEVPAAGESLPGAAVEEHALEAPHRLSKMCDEKCAGGEEAGCVDGVVKCIRFNAPVRRGARLHCLSCDVHHKRSDHGRPSFVYSVQHYRTRSALGFVP